MKYLLFFFLSININSYATIYDRSHMFSIYINANDKMMVQDEFMNTNKLKLVLYNFIKANQKAESNMAVINYSDFSVDLCLKEINSINTKIKSINKNSYEYLILNSSLAKWQKKLNILKSIKKSHYRFINNLFSISIKMNSKTSYQMYINVLSAIKETITKIREEKAQELFKMSYLKLVSNKNNVQMQRYVQAINFLVPEKIIDMPNSQYRWF